MLSQHALRRLKVRRQGALYSLPVNKAVLGSQWVVPQLGGDSPWHYWQTVHRDGKPAGSYTAVHVGLLIGRQVQPPRRAALVVLLGKQSARSDAVLSLLWQQMQQGHQ